MFTRLSVVHALCWLVCATIALHPQECRAQASDAIEVTTAKSLPIWPEFAPGESTRNTGEALPPRETDKPVITRVQNITQPTLDVFPADNPNGAAVLILPGGGFRYVVPDLEGSEAAQWLNDLGIAAFVLRYRTTERADEPWKRPLQDSQRALRWIRAHADDWGIDPNKVGLLGFSAGGQVAGIHLTATEPAYTDQDAVDQQSFRPDFSLLIYPWRIYDDATQSLIAPIQVTKQTPPAFLVHTHDDASTSLGAVHYYAELKKQGVAAELHVYQNGGHGYGTRPRPNSMIGSWTDRATEWLQINGLSDQ